LLWSQNSLESRKTTLSLDNKEELKKPKASGLMKERWEKGETEMV
jgi:hypothetical protein